MEFVRFKQQLNYYNKSKFCTFYNFSHILKQMFYPENEEPYCLNLTQKYIQHWCFLHGLRQLYQNWMDAIRQKNLGKIIKIRKTIQGNLIKFQPTINGKILAGNFIIYDKHRKTLKLQNEGSFKIRSMLMGSSTRETDPNFLGQFGQGMKLSMIVLLRKDFLLSIQSGDYEYYPSLKKWHYQYDNKVLYVKIQKRSETKDNTLVTIQNISQADFQKFRYISLALVDQSQFKIIQFDMICKVQKQHKISGKGRLILSKNPELIGKIYKMGVRLQIRESKEHLLHYSYDFDQVEVGRDRDCVNNMWQLYRLQSILHANILNNRLALRQQRPQLEKDLNLHEQKMYQSLKVNGFCSYYLHQYVSKQGIDKIYPFFLEQFKSKELYPIYSHDHQAQINKYFLIYGLKADFYPTQSTSYHLYHSLIKSSFFKTIKIKVQTQILGKIQSDLNDNQKQKMKQIQKKISVLLPQINNYIFKLKDLPKVVCYKSDQLKTIFLNIHEINNEQKVKRQLLRLMLIE